MKRLSLLACCVFIGPAAFGQYSYWYTESFLGSLSSNWTHNSSVTDYSSGLATTSGEGSLISTLTIPTNPPATGGMYEVQTTLNLSGSGGTFVTYVDATSNALSAAGSSTGTFYSIESSPTITSGVCTLAIVINKSTSGSITSLASGTAACSSTTVIRTVRAWNWIHVYVNAVDSLWAYDTSIATGQAGVGVAGSAYPNTMASVGLGVLEIVNPVPVNAGSIGTSSFPDRVDIQWQGTTDNTGGSGLSDYSLYRDPGFVWLGLIPAAAVGSFSDTTVTQGTSYTYHLYAVDYHLNAVSTSFSVTTAPTGAVDPRQVGVRSTGAYWGASPEQINLLSGNVNFSLPLLKAQGRSSGVGFSLSYNSQNWRQDGGGIWDLGRDVGFGYGWKLLAGSITPFWSDYWNIDHYTFTDSTGAEYRLSVNTGNVWSSTESIYLQYDANAGILHFPDGTFWVMGCESSGFEQDAGTYYPTVMEDTNGNQILLTYADGIGTSWSNSSARIQSIEDVRATNPLGTYYTYQFAYNSDPIPHLIHVTNSIATGEAYDFSYSSFTLDDPFTSSSFGTSTKLTEVDLANDYPAKYLLTADSSGQLTKAQLTHGGYLRWAYQPTTYTGSRNQMEATTRYLCKDVAYTGGGSLACTTNGSTNDETAYPIYHESGTSSLTIHSCAMIDDPGGLGEKYWTFSSNPTYMGLVTHYQGRSPSGGTSCSVTPASTALTQNDLTWTQDSAGNRYIGEVDTTADPGASYAKQKKTTETLDTYGNVTAVNNYDWGSLSTPARSYAYSYLNTSPYTSRYIFNRLQQASVTPAGGSPTILGAVSYDVYALWAPSGSPREWDSSFTTVSARGNVSVATDVSGISTTTEYDRYGNVYIATGGSGVATSATTTTTTNFAAPDALTVGGSLNTTLAYSPALGPTSETGPNGTSVSIGYDANARPTTSTSPFGASTTTTYSDSSTAPSTCTMVNGRWTLTTLDGLGRPLITYTGHGSSCGTGTTLTQAETAYDSCGCSPLGKLKEQWVPRVYMSSTTNAAATTYTYDGIGRTVSKAVVGALSTPDTQGTTYYVYQGNTVKVTDPAGKIKAFTSDAFGNLLQVVEDPSGLNYSTTYAYDVLNHLIGVSMPRSGLTQTRSWSYTGNFLMSATNAENATVSYTYGSNNKVATRTDAKGQAVAYSYDSMARLSLVQRYPNGLSFAPDPCQQENYYYDNANPLGSSYPTNGAGRLSAVQYMGGYNPTTTPACDTTFTEMYNYGVPGAPVGKQLSVTRSLGGLPSTFSLSSTYTYDTEGRTTAETYPTDHSGTTSSLSYTFDSMGRLNTMTDNIGMTTIVGSTTYGPANELTSISGGAWGSETRTYNSIKQLTGIDSTGTYVTYAYPAIGNNGKISSESDGWPSGEVITYTYDSLNRLMAASDQPTWPTTWGQSYTYDGFGNLTNVAVTQGSAPSFSQGYDVHNQVSGSSDANGNPSNVPLPAYGTSAAAAYDVENRLVSLSTASPVASYSYAPGNKRVWRGNWSYSGSTWSRTQDEITFWSISGRKLATYNVTSSSGLYATQSGFNYYFGARLIQNTAGYVYPNRLGSKGQFFPYGQERGVIGPNDTEKFTGYFRDAESGNDYAEQRYVSPGYGRFLTPDRSSTIRMEDPGSWNKYAYTRGDPVNRVDRHGTDDDDNFGDCNIAYQCPLIFTEEDDEEDSVDDIINDPAFMFYLIGDPNSPCYGDPGACTEDDLVTFATEVFGQTQPSAQQQPKQRRRGGQKNSLCNNQGAVNFVKDNLADATTLAAKLSVPASFVLAVAAAESQWGTSDAATLDNNWFGIHWGNGTLASANGGSQSTRNPILASWASGTDGFLGSGGVMVALAMSDGATNLNSASQFFQDIHAQFGTPNANYVSDMRGVLNSVQTRLNCP